MRSYPSCWSTTLAKLGLRRKRQRNAKRAISSHRRLHCGELLEQRALFAVFTWDGGGANNNWTTAANWVGDVAPSAGDDLVFNGAVRTSTQNNFTAGTSFNSITFAANNFSLAGNRVTLADEIVVNTGVTSSAISLNVAAGAGITIDVVDTSLTISSVISGSNSVTKIGDGTLTLSGSNTFTGATTISDGVLQINDGGALASSSVVNNSSLVFNRVSSGLTFSPAISGTGSITKQGAAAVALAGSNTYSGGTTITAGSLLVGNVAGSAGTLGTGAIVNDGLLTFRRSGTTTVADAISGSGELFVDVGTVILTGTNTYSGTTTIGSNTTLRIGSGGTTGTLGSGNVVSEHVSTTGTLIFNRSDSVTVNNAISGAVNVRQFGTGALTVAGNISGAATVSQQASGVLSLNGSNTYTGATTVDASRTLKVGSSSAIGSGVISVSGTLDANGYSPTLVGLSGSGTITSTAAGSVTINLLNDVTSTFSGIFQDGSGTVAIAKKGTGTLSLYGVNTYSGGTTIEAGTVRVSTSLGSGRLGTGAIVNDGTVIFQSSNTTTISDAISGAGSIVQSAGTLILTGNNTYAGTTTIGANATLRVGSGGTTGTLGSGSVLSESPTVNGTLTVNRSDGLTITNDITGAISFGQQGGGAVTISGDISGSASVFQQAAGVLTLSGTNSYTGGTTIDSSRTLRAGSGSALGAGAITVNGTLDLNGNSATVGGLSGGGTITSSVAGVASLSAGSNNLTTTFSGVIEDGSGTVALVKQGTGTIDIQGNNTYSGGTEIASGTLRLENFGSASLGAGDILNNGVLSFYNASSTKTIASNISGSGEVRQEAGTVVLTGANTYSGKTTIASLATLAIGAGGTTGTLGTGDVISGGASNSGDLIFNRSNSIAVNNTIIGAIDVRQQGPGTLTLGGANSYTGTTTIDSGRTLRLGSAGAIGSGTVVVNGTLDIDGYDTSIGAISGAGNIQSASSGGGLSVGANITYAFSFAGTIEDGAGSLALTKVGPGTLTLSGTNTYSGATTISAGTLILGIANAIPSGSGKGNVDVDGTLDLKSFDLTINGLSGDGVITSSHASGATLTVGGNDQTSGFAGSIDDGIGTIEVVKIGSGVVTLSGINDYSGNTTLSGGTLAFAESGLGGGDIVFDGGALRWVVGNAEDVSSRFAAIGSGETAVLDTNGNNVTLTGVVAGSGGLAKIGDGTLTLDGLNTYTGTTTISQGAIAADIVAVSGGSSSLGNAASAIILGDSSPNEGTLIYTGTSATLTRGVTVSGGGGRIEVASGTETLAVATGGISAGGALTFGGSGAANVSAVISGAGSLTKTGQGTLTLSGANSYTGTTTISQGTLIADDVTVGGGVSNLGNASSAIALGNGTHQGVFSYAGNSATFSRGVTVNSGGGRIDATVTGQTLTIATGGVNAGGAITIGGAGDVNISSIVSGVGPLTKLGSGTLALSGTNTYSGSTTIAAGTLLLGGSNVLPSGSGKGNVEINGTLDLNGYDLVVNGLSGDGSVTSSQVGSSTLTIGGNNQTSEFAGSIGDGIGTVEVTKIGSGVVTLSGVNNFSGDTTLNAGTLAFDQGGLGSGDVVFDGGTLRWIAGNDEDVSGRFAAIASGESAILDTNGNDVTLAGSITGSGGLAKLGAGTLTLDGSNTYAGGSAVDGGNLQYGATALPSTGQIIIGLAGALNATGPYATAAAWLGSGRIDTSSAGTLALVANESTPISLGSYTNLYLGAVISAELSGALTPAGGGYRFGGGGGTLTVTSSLGDSGGATSLAVRGNVTLSGVNSYSGGTTLDSGTLSIGSDDAIGGSSSSIVFSGGVLRVTGTTLANLNGHTVNWSTFDGGFDIDASGHTFTMSQNLSGSGALTKLGPGALVLSGTNSLSGNTFVSAGTLRVGGSQALPTGAGRGDVIVNGILDLNGNSVTVNSLSGSGVITSSQAGPVTLTVGDDDRTSAFAGTIENGSGAVSLTKIGSGTFVLAGNSTYTGATEVEEGVLSLEGNLNSHATDTGGDVTGWFFRDPDLAVAVRKALGMSANAVLTQGDLASLSSLTVDSNVISDLKGLENAANLQSLTLLPKDFSVAGQLAAPEFSASLEWLSGLQNLQVLVMQGAGITDEVLATLGAPASLHTLDLRYNELEIIPESVVALDDLSSLFVYGNSDLTDNPRTGLQNLAGALISIDVAADHPENATTIEELAAALYYLPVEIYEYLVNTIEFEAYAGAKKGPLAVLQTGRGNDWDTASLLAALLTEGNVLQETDDLRTQDYRYSSGRVHLPIATAMGYFGVADEDALEQVVENAKLNPELVLDGLGQPTGIVFDHTWLEAKLPLGGEEWVSLDPSWKFQQHQDAARNILADVPWNTDIDANEYFSEVRSELPSEYYEAQVRAYLAQYESTISIADLAYSGEIVVQTLTSLPTSLPYDLWDVDHVWDAESVDPRPVEVYASIPEEMTHRLRVVLHDWIDNQYFDSTQLVLPEIALSSLAIRPTASVNGWVRPELILDGQVIAQANTSFSPNESFFVTIEYYQPGDVNEPTKQSTHGTPIFDPLRLAGNYYSILVDAGQVSQHLIKEQRRQVVDAAIDYMDGAPLDMDANVGGFLHLASLEYISQADAAAEAIYGITASKRNTSHVGFGLITAAGDEGFHRPGNSVPYDLQDPSPEVLKSALLPVVPKGASFDLASLATGFTSIDGDTSHELELRHIIGHTGSALEHAVWEGLTNANAMSTIKSLQLAGEEGIPIIEIAPYTSSGTVQSLLGLHHTTESSIATYSSQGYTIWAPQYPTDLDDWTGVGFYAQSAAGAGAYVISGNLNGGAIAGLIRWILGASGGEPTTQDQTSDPITLANGILTHDETDVSFPGLGFPLGLARHFQSDQTGDIGYDSDRGFGEGWSFTYSDRLEDSTDVSDPIGTKIWFTDSGIRRRFVPDGVGGYVTPDAIFGTLVDDGIGLGHTWTDKEGNVVHFDEADGNGYSRLEWAADRYGNGVEVSYDGSGRIDVVTDLVTPSRWIEFAYTGDKITSISDFTGRTWTYDYNVTGQLISATTPSDVDTAQATVEYEYHSGTTLDGLLKKVINSNGRATEFSYYPNRWGFEVKFAEGDVQTLAYNPHRNRTAYIDERNLVTYYAFNEDGNTIENVYSDRTSKSYMWQDNLKTSETDEFGQTEAYAYDANGNRTSVTDRLGYVTTYAYTDYSNLETVTRHNGTGGGDDAVTQYRYFTDGFGKDDKLQEVEDADGNVTSYTYAGASGTRGLPDSVTAPLGTATTGDPDDYVTAFTYNDAGQILTVATRADVGSPIEESFTYDGRGEQLTYVDANGEVTNSTYDLLGRVLTQTLPDPDGVGGNPAPVMSFAYDLKGNLLSSTLSSSTPDRVTSYVYDSMNRMTRVENPDGTYRTRQYDLLSNVIAETDELGRVARYLYDERNRVTATIAPDGNVLATSYDGSGRVVALTDPLGHTTAYQYDALGRLTNTIDAKGGQTSRAYDDSGNLYSVTDALGRTTIFYYDLLQQLTTVTEADPDGAGPLASPVTSYFYDGNGNLTGTTDPLGRTTVYVHDEVNRVVMLIAPDPDGAGPLDSPVTDYTYDAVGNLLTIDDPLGNVTTNEYDALNRLIAVTQADPDGAGPLASPVTSYLYDADGNLASTIDPLGRQTDYAYDKRNRLVRVTQPAPYGVMYSESPVTEYEYDAVGNRVSVTDPLGVVTRYGYDALDRLTSIANPDGGVSRSEYDAVGNLKRTFDPLNLETLYGYDELNRLVSVTDAEEGMTAFEYDAVGNRTSLTDPNENVTEFVYDGLNRLVERIDPLNASSYFEYDAVGNLTETTDREGRVRTYAYDGLDRLTTETWLDGMSTVNTLSFAYDAVGNLLTAEDDFSSYEFEYDNLYRLIQSDNAGTPGAPNAVLDYAYDAVGNRTSTSDDAGVTVDSVYDDLNRLHCRTWSGGGIDEARIDFGYNARGERTAAYRFSDLAGTQQIGRSSYGYDAVGRISGIDHFDALDAAIAEYDYAYDVAGQLNQWWHHGESIDFTHDDTGQLTSADYATQTDESYAYDANGNRTGGGMAIGDSNQVLSDGTYDYAYDAEGNLVLKTESSTGDYVEYAYDHRNRMISAKTYSSGVAILQEVEFTYDLFDRRIAKTVDGDGTGVNPPVTVHTAYDGEHAWADFDALGNVTARYLFGDRVDEIVARWTTSDGTAWYLTDHLGTVRDIVDDVGGLINTVTYDSFGNIVSQTNAIAGDRFTYTGREYDSELDLYYYRARYYDPQSGRFVSQDPIGFAAGDANVYRYVGNLPTARLDPFGLAVESHPIILHALSDLFFGPSVVVGGTLAFDPSLTTASMLDQYMFGSGEVYELNRDEMGDLISAASNNIKDAVGKKINPVDPSTLSGEFKLFHQFGKTPGLVTIGGTHLEIGYVATPKGDGTFDTAVTVDLVDRFVDALNIKNWDLPFPFDFPGGTPFPIRGRGYLFLGGVEPGGGGQDSGGDGQGGGKSGSQC